MKILISIMIPIIVLFSGCQKSSPVAIPIPPKVTTINPTSGPANTVVTISGTNFRTNPTDNTVKFNGKIAAVSSATTTSLTVTVPPGGTTGNVTVTTADGSGTGPVFTYTGVSIPPTITAINPDSAAVGAIVTISGTNFKTAATDDTVKFNGVTAIVQSATATSLTVLVPASGSTGTITVTTADGTATGPSFKYITSTDVYVVGKGINGFGYWKNGVFTDLPSNCVEAWSIFADGTDVYVAGADINTGGPAYWKNGSVVDLPMSAGHNGGRAYSVFVSAGDVYVAGLDFNNGAYSLPRVWKNGVALSIPLSTGNFSGGQPVTSGVAYSVFVDGTDVYAGGTQASSNGGVVTYWKNGIPVTLTDGSTYTQTAHVFVSNGDVYVAGNDGINANVWKNGVPTTLVTPNSSIQGIPTGIYVAGTDVYTSAYYQDLAKVWKNTTMIDLTTTTAGPGIYESATGVTGVGSDIYISGNYISKGYGFWKNGDFTALSGASIVNGIFVK